MPSNGIIANTKWIATVNVKSRRKRTTAEGKKAHQRQMQQAKNELDLSDRARESERQLFAYKWGEEMRINDGMKNVRKPTGEAKQEKSDVQKL